MVDSVVCGHHILLHYSNLITMINLVVGRGDRVLGQFYMNRIFIAVFHEQGHNLSERHELLDILFITKGDRHFYKSVRYEKASSNYHRIPHFQLLLSTIF